MRDLMNCKENIWPLRWKVLKVTKVEKSVLHYP